MVILLMMVVTGLAVAATPTYPIYQWVGSDGGPWETPTNWSLRASNGTLTVQSASYPNLSSDIAYIPSGKVVLTASHSIGTLLTGSDNSYATIGGSGGVYKVTVTNLIGSLNYYNVYDPSATYSLIPTSAPVQYPGARLQIDNSDTNAQPSVVIDVACKGYLDGTTFTGLSAYPMVGSGMPSQIAGVVNNSTAGLIVTGFANGLTGFRNSAIISVPVFATPLFNWSYLGGTISVHSKLATFTHCQVTGQISQDYASSDCQLLFQRQNTIRPISAGEAIFTTGYLDIDHYFTIDAANAATKITAQNAIVLNYTSPDLSSYSSDALVTLAGGANGITINTPSFYQALYADQSNFKLATQLKEKTAVRTWIDVTSGTVAFIPNTASVYGNILWEVDSGATLDVSALTGGLILGDIRASVNARNTGSPTLRGSGTIKGNIACKNGYPVIAPGGENDSAYGSNYWGLHTLSEAKADGLNADQSATSISITVPSNAADYEARSVGALTITGDLTLIAQALVKIDLATESGNYDVLNVGGTLTLNYASINAYRVYWDYPIDPITSSGYIMNVGSRDLRAIRYGALTNASQIPLAGVFNGDIANGQWILPKSPDSTGNPPVATQLVANLDASVTPNAIFIAALGYGTSAPVVVDQSVSLDEGSTVEVTLPILSSGWRYQLVYAPRHGSLARVSSSTNAYRYTADLIDPSLWTKYKPDGTREDTTLAEGDVAPDSFVFVATDGQVVSAPLTVNMGINWLNNKPTFQVNTNAFAAVANGASAPDSFSTVNKNAAQVTKWVFFHNPKSEPYPLRHGAIEYYFPSDYGIINAKNETGMHLGGGRVMTASLLVSNSALFSVQPTLTFFPAPNAWVNLNHPGPSAMNGIMNTDVWPNDPYGGSGNWIFVTDDNIQNTTEFGDSRLWINLVSAPTNVIPALMTFTPKDSTYGQATITFTLTDQENQKGDGASDDTLAEHQIQIDIQQPPVWAAPSLTLNKTEVLAAVNDDATHSSWTIAGVATGTIGTAKIAPTSLTYHLDTSKTDATILSATINANSGTISIVPLLGSSSPRSTTIGIYVQDDGGTTDRTDTSATQYLKITVYDAWIDTAVTYTATSPFSGSSQSGFSVTPLGALSYITASYAWGSKSLTSAPIYASTTPYSIALSITKPYVLASGSSLTGSLTITSLPVAITASNVQMLTGIAPVYGFNSSVFPVAADATAFASVVTYTPSASAALSLSPGSYVLTPGGPTQYGSTSYGINYAPITYVAGALTVVAANNENASVQSSSGGGCGIGSGTAGILLGGLAIALFFMLRKLHD
jgi:hypothetical protein